MEKTLKFLQDAKTFYLATVEDDQPRVRPFGAIAIIDGKLYTCTNNTKKVYKQLLANPKMEISAMAGGKWIRLEGKLIPDHRDEVRKAMLDANPSLSSMYSIGDGIFEVLYFEDCTATFCSFTEAPEVETF